MSKWTNFLSNFVEVLPDEEKPVAEEVKQVPNMVSDLSQPAIKVKAEIPASNSSVDEKILENIYEMLNEKNIPGPDYLELKESANKENVKKLESDEKKRLAMAFAMGNMSKDVVISSIDTYQKYISEEREIGLAQIDKTYQARVTKKKETILADKAKLEDLKREISEITSRITASENEIAQSELDINGKKNKLMATFDFVSAKFEQDKQILIEIL